LNTALIIGVNGQDGSYLAEYLLELGYQVHGTIRRSSTPSLERLHGIRDKITLHYCDLCDAGSLSYLIAKTSPSEVYNLGAMSDVKVSFDTPVYAAEVDGVGVTRLLEAVCRHVPSARVYQAGSSEMFGTNPVTPYNERSTFRPASPYAAAKCYAHHIVVNYRESYGLHASNGILFNHESERRGVEFVTRKITRAIAAIERGEQNHVRLGSLSARRDWGYAPDYVRAIHAIVRRTEPSDWVVATGEAHSVAEFAEKAFAHVGKDWAQYVAVDPAMFRPVDPPILLGDASKAREQLGWEPTTTFDELVRRMVEHDLEAARCA
jgi:GDPmannose 4,6-dehydratase